MERKSQSRTVPALLGFVRGLVVRPPCALLLALSLTCPAEAGPGDLDSSFGMGGKVTTDFGGTDDTAAALAIQAKGKIVAAGFSNASGAYDFALARYNHNGTLDDSFGPGGRVTTNFGGDDFALGLAIQADDKIVVAGESATLISADVALARYNADGTLDISFGTGGKVISDFGGTCDFATSVAIQANGKIVVAGSSGATCEGPFDFGLARYNTDGTPDITFGTGGKVTTNFGGSDDQASAVAIQADGKIVAAGFTDASGTHDFALARYNQNGTLDSTFGTGGKVTTDFGGTFDLALDVAIQADSKIVAAGFTDASGTRDFALARYNANGSLDVNFGPGGRVTTNFGGTRDAATGLAIQADDKIVAAGVSNASGARDFALARYNTDGTLDISFGTGGRVTTDFGGGDGGNAVAFEPKGKIVVAGSSNASSTFDFALARYSAGGPSN